MAVQKPLSNKKSGEWQWSEGHRPCYESHCMLPAKGSVVISATYTAVWDQLDPQAEANHLIVPLPQVQHGSREAAGAAGASGASAQSCPWHPRRCQACCGPLVLSRSV
jgi:hypothetical protein